MRIIKIIMSFFRWAINLEIFFPPWLLDHTSMTPSRYKSVSSTSGGGYDAPVEEINRTVLSLVILECDVLSSGVKWPHR